MPIYQVGASPSRLVQAELVQLLVLVSRVTLRALVRITPSAAAVVAWMPLTITAVRMAALAVVVLLQSLVALEPVGRVMLAADQVLLRWVPAAGVLAHPVMMERHSMAEMVVPV
jgi:hypothetical protein